MTGHGGGPCTCPTAYRRCKYVVLAEQQAGTCTDHGGWGQIQCECGAYAKWQTTDGRCLGCGKVAK